MEEDTFEPDYEEDILDPIPVVSTVRGSSLRKTRVQSCPMCLAKFTNVRRHVLCSHLPWYVVPYTACWTCKLQLAQDGIIKNHIEVYHRQQEEKHVFEEVEQGERWVKLMNGLIHKLEMELGKNLLEYILEEPSFDNCVHAVLHWRDIPLVNLFNRVNNLQPVHISHKVYPPEFQYSLLHWKILAIAISKTNSDEILQYEKEQPHELSEVHLIDSHFHLDMLIKQTRISGLPQITEGNMSVIKLVANYCYPRNWPSSKERKRLREDERVYFSYGIHPHMVLKESKDRLLKWIGDMETLLECRKVVGVGECGLDISGNLSRSNIRKQEEVFQLQLDLARKKELPLIIHCRGKKWVQQRCLKMVSDSLNTDHPIHRHCFSEEFSVYEEWKRHFPSCTFGLSPLLLVNPDLEDVTRRMDLADMILESDAPYLCGEGYRNGHPKLVMEIAKKVAVLRNVPVGQVATVTTQNAIRTYRM